MKRIYLPILFGGVILLSCSDLESRKESRKQFRLLDGSTSGLSFSNNIQEDVSTKFNLFDYDYFYNGAGVGIADINNDGLDDVLLTGNQVKNRLFLSKGDLRFEDITDKAGINTNKFWSNGVTFADVNQDGFLDVYISQGGPHTPEERKNLLFVNNGDLTFSEKAESFGLDDSSISTHSAFFDFDNDGDLDCFVMNETPLYGMGPSQFFSELRSNPKLIYESSCHLYENNDGVFEDVTLKSGIYRPAFGLGLAVSDVNEDGWLDIYVANDYYLPDNLYINNGNGFFVDQIAERTNQISFYGMGVDIADVNNDLAQDIFVLDMASSDHIRAKTLMASMDVKGFDLLTNQLGFHTQYMFNSLQLNDGSNKFDNVSQLAKVAMTDWSWAVLMDDFNNDSYQDVYVTNGYRRYALDNDFKNEVNRTKQQYSNKVPLEVKAQLYKKMPSEKLSNLMYTTKADFDFKEVASKWGLDKPSFSNGAAFSDLDNDGDLDLVVNNIDENAFLFENTNPGDGNYLRVGVQGRTSEPFAKVYIYYDGRNQMKEIKRVRGYRSSVDNTAHFGLGEISMIDSIRVKWLDGSTKLLTKISANQTLSVMKKEKEEEENNGGVITKKVSFKGLALGHKHEENYYNDLEVETLLPYKQSSIGPKISLHEESKMMFVGGAYGSNSFVYQYNGDELVKVAEIPSSEYEDIEGKFLDVENDGDMDLFVVTGGNEFPPGHPSYVDRLYINNGSNEFSHEQINDLDQMASSGGALEIMDIDNDGFEDIVVGNRITPQYYPFPGISYVLKNGNGKLNVDKNQIIPNIDSLGIVNDIQATDIDGDGWEDLIVVGEWTNIQLFKNEQGKFTSVSGGSEFDKMKGWWFSITETDINQDNLPDFVVGNVGRNLKLKASLESPLKVMANDFDSTGTVDVVLSKKYKGEYVPVRGRECSSGQMPFLKEKFPTYEGFATASIDEIFGTALEASYVAEATTLESKVMINKGNWEFDLIDLPWQAQMFPILDAEVNDFNKDGKEDVILVGNIYETEVETPRLDAKSGLILYSGENGYEAGPSFNIPGNVKSIEGLQMDSSLHFIVGRNNDFLLGYSYNNR